MRFRSIQLAVIACFTPVIAFAHGSHGSGVLSGFTHPIFGFDHFVAIVGTGILAYLLNPSRWYVPVLAFVGAMIIGGLFGISNEASDPRC
jgi:urease accessory protein